MKPSLPILGGVLALAGLSLALTACDTSPYAAQVNSQVIKETALNSEIRAWAHLAISLACSIIRR